MTKQRMTNHEIMTKFLNDEFLAFAAEDVFVFDSGGTLETYTISPSGQLGIYGFPLFVIRSALDIRISSLRIRVHSWLMTGGSIVSFLSVISVNGTEGISDIEGKIARGSDERLGRERISNPWLMIGG
jgi:hypothetical protein